MRDVKVSWRVKEESDSDPRRQRHPARRETVDVGSGWRWWAGSARRPRRGSSDGPACSDSPRRVVSLTSHARRRDHVQSCPPTETRWRSRGSGEKLADCDICLKMIGSLGDAASHDGSTPGICLRAVARRPADRVLPPRFRGRAGRDPPCVALVGRTGRLGDFLRSRRSPSSSPDGQWLAAARVRPGGALVVRTRSPGTRIFILVPVQGGEPRHIPLPQPAGEAFLTQFLSPDRQHLAYQGSSSASRALPASWSSSASFFVRRDPPGGSARRPILRSRVSPGPRRRIPCSSSGVRIHRLWRVADRPEADPPTTVELAGHGAVHPLFAAFSGPSRFRAGA